jgi:hypothetical protein
VKGETAPQDEDRRSLSRPSISNRAYSILGNELELESFAGVVDAGISFRVQVGGMLNS